jgi:hypothetical protein
VPFACLAEALAKAGALLSLWLTFTKSAGKLKEIFDRLSRQYDFRLAHPVYPVGYILSVSPAIKTAGFVAVGHCERKNLP